MDAQQITEVLIKVEQQLWRKWHKEQKVEKYSKEALRAATKIFMSVLYSRMAQLQQGEDMEKEDRTNMNLKCATDLKNLIKTYTGIDTTELYK